MDNNDRTSLDVTSKKKILYVEILRIFCIVFVIFNHTNYHGYVYFLSFDTGSLPYWFYMFFTVFAGISVPVFFMISGMLLLGKSESVGHIWKKRILKYVIILLVFSLIYYLMETVLVGKSCSAKDFFLRFYTEGIIIPYWFLYVYISFLILLPFIRKIAKDISETEFVYLMVIYFVFVTLTEILQYRLSGGTVTLNPCLNPSIICNMVFFYPVIGYYLGVRLKTVTNKMLLISFGLFVISIVDTMLITNYKLKLTGVFTEENANSFLQCARPFQTIFIFLLARKLFENKTYPKQIEKAVKYIGGCVFGIYLIEEIYRKGLYSVYYALDSRIDGFAAIWLYVLLIFLICLIQVAAFRYLALFFRKIMLRKNS